MPVSAHTYNVLYLWECPNKLLLLLLFSILREVIFIQ